MNRSDAERLGSLLGDFDCQKTDDEKKADIVLVFACSVRQHAIDRILGKIGEWEKRNPRPKIVLTGCVLEADRKKMEKRFDLVFDLNKETDKFIIFLEKLTGRKYDFRKDFNNYLEIIPDHQSSFEAFVPIMTGCDHFCTFCAVPYTRGRERSRDEKEIINEVEGLVKRGYKSITLLGQNVNSYGKRGGGRPSGTAYSPTSVGAGAFINLIKKIDEISGDYLVRFYSNHPEDINEDLIKTLKNLKHFPHYIHLPLQSGDDGVLERMNRHYTAREYLDKVSIIKKYLPDCVITTDIIVGFPGETKEKFEKTKAIMEEVGFDMAFIAQYSPRPGTVSAKRFKDDVAKKEKAERFRILTDVLGVSSLAIHKKLLGQKIRVLVYSARKDGVLHGKTDGLKNIIFTGSNDLIGSFVDVSVTKAEEWRMRGEITN